MEEFQLLDALHCNKRQTAKSPVNDPGHSSSVLHAPTANLPVPVGASIRAAAVRPIASIHAPHPYTINPTNTFSNNTNTARILIANAKSVTDVTNAEPLFYVGQSDLLSLVLMQVL